ncbi:MAG: hypothetical protein U1E42_00430 [Rhodospirillales bacterium]
MDSDLFFRLIEQVNVKLDDLGKSAEVVKGEVSAIKTRLFNGLTDTTRETYSKVIVLEKKQEQYEDTIHSMQNTWMEKFATHDTKEKIYHSIIGIVMGFIVTIFAGLIVFELEKYQMLKIMSHEIQSESHEKRSGDPRDPALSPVGP